MENEQLEKLNQSMQPVLKAMNELFAQEFESPNYRYFKDKKKNMYFWTTKPMIENGKKRFISGVYRYFKGEKCWRAKKKVFHAKRNKAKARAYKLYQKITGVENGE